MSINLGVNVNLARRDIFAQRSFCSRDTFAREDINTKLQVMLLQKYLRTAKIISNQTVLNGALLLYAYNFYFVKLKAKTKNIKFTSYH